MTNDHGSICLHNHVFLSPISFTENNGCRFCFAGSFHREADVFSSWSKIAFHKVFQWLHCALYRLCIHGWYHCTKAIPLHYTAAAVWDYTDTQPIQDYRRSGGLVPLGASCLFMSRRRWWRSGEPAGSPPRSCNLGLCLDPAHEGRGLSLEGWLWTATGRRVGEDSPLNGSFMETVCLQRCIYTKWWNLTKLSCYEYITCTISFCLWKPFYSEFQCLHNHVFKLAASSSCYSCQRCIPTYFPRFCSLKLNHPKLVIDPIVVHFIKKACEKIQIKEFGQRL